MEFRKIYIKRLLPVLGIILVLILLIVGHSTLKAQAQAADTKEMINQQKTLVEQVDTEKLKSELSSEMYLAIEDVVLNKLSLVNLSDYFSAEDYGLIYQKIEESLLENNLFEGEQTKLTDEQKAIVNSLISDALTLYSETNLRTELSDEMKKKINELIEGQISDKLSEIKSDAAMSESEKRKLAQEISEAVQHSILEYITEHIQLIYGEGENSDSGRTLVCDKNEHAHNLDCYSAALICDAEEDENHMHSDECYEYELECDVEEHIHADECYDTASTGSSGNSSPCVHVHVDYLLTDADRQEIVKEILEGTDLSGVLSEVFYDEIQKSLSEIVKEQMYNAILENLDESIQEKMDDFMDSFEERLQTVQEQANALESKAGETENRLASLENAKPTIRYNEVTGMIECYSEGEWKSFMSASSIWAANGILYSSGVKAENFDGFKPFVNSSDVIYLTETDSAIKIKSAMGFVSGKSAENTYTTDPAKPIESTAQYDAIRISYGVKGGRNSVTYRDPSDNQLRTGVIYHELKMKVQILEFGTNRVVSEETVTSNGNFVQDTMELDLPEQKPYVIRIVYGYNNTADKVRISEEHIIIEGEANIYSMQCFKR